MTTASVREMMETAVSFVITLVLGTVVTSALVPDHQIFTSPLHYLLTIGALAISAYSLFRTFPVKAPRSSVPSASLVPAIDQERILLTRPPLSDTARASIAVLPLDNLSGDPGDVHLCQGFSAEIIRALFGIADLRVASFQQTLAYDKGDLDRVTRELDVRYVLTGSLQRSGDHVRIIAMLTDAHERTQLWSESYSRDLADIFTVQSQIADAIATQVGSEYLNVVTRDVSLELPQNLSAWGLVHRGMNFWITSYTKHASEETVSLLEQALRQQPDYAMAHAELGFIYSQRVMNAFTKDQAGEARIALEHVNRAYKLAPRDPTVMERAALVWFNSGLKNRSVRVVRDVLQGAPYDLVAWGYLACALGMGGDEEGIAEAQEILSRLLTNATRHPSVPFWNYFAANTYAQAGDWEKAQSFASISVDIHPGFCIGWFALGNACGNLGDVEGALQAEREAKKSNPDFSFQMFYEYMLGHSSQWENREMQFSGLLKAGLIRGPGER